ncbi:MAG: heparinase II/III family protein [Desulfomonilaceae bacterium]
MVKFVKEGRHPITDSNIDKWVNSRRISMGNGNLDTGSTNSDILKAFPKAFLADNEFWKTFERLYPAEKEQLINFALSVINGRIELFGWKQVSVLIPSLEFRDIAATEIKRGWSSSYYWDVNFYQSKNHPDFDIKWLWELERLQFLLWLGAAWKLTGDNNFAAVAQKILETWFQSISYPYGVEWSSNLEVGLRLLSISRCHFMCMDSPSWNQEFLSKLSAWEYLHATHLREELTLHHTIGNHQLGEASSLLWFAIVTSSLSEASTWRNYALKIINRIIPNLIFSDGVYVEQSTSYLKFVAEFVLPLICLNSVSGIGFVDANIKRIISSLEFIQSISNCGKETPMIGDSDSGSAIGWRLSPYWDFSWLLAAGSTLLDAPRLAIGIERFPAEAFLNTGLEGLNKFDSIVRRSGKHILSQSIKSDSYVDFPVGGYHVSTDSYFHLIFDSGPLGIYPGFGHGHADALAILLNVKNRPVVIDSGTMRYNTAPEVRGYFRKTYSHNTLVVDGRNQAEVLDTFKWGSDYSVKWNDTIARDGYRLFSGLLFSGSFMHQRMVLHVLEKGLIILDRTHSENNIAIEGHLHFAPDIMLKPTGVNNFLVTCGNELIEVILPQSSTYCGIVKGSENPMLGWYSENYGEMVPTGCLKFCSAGSNGVELVTVIRRRGFSLEWPRELSAFSFPG